jgi:hypothetical protein
VRRRGKEIREENAVAFYINKLLHGGLTKLQNIMPTLIETNWGDDGIDEIGNSGSRKKR